MYMCIYIYIYTRVRAGEPTEKRAGGGTSGRGAEAEPRT